MAMNKETTIQARIDLSLKDDVESIFDELGLSFSESIRLFLKQVKLTGGLPFEVKIPEYNALTRKTIEEAKKGKGLNKYKNPQELYKKLGI